MPVNAWAWPSVSELGVSAAWPRLYRQIQPQPLSISFKSSLHLDLFLKPHLVHSTHCSRLARFFLSHFPLFDLRTQQLRSKLIPLYYPCYLSSLSSDHASDGRSASAGTWFGGRLDAHALHQTRSAFRSAQASGTKLGAHPHRPIAPPLPSHSYTVMTS